MGKRGRPPKQKITPNTTILNEDNGEDFIDETSINKIFSTPTSSSTTSSTIPNEIDLEKRIETSLFAQKTQKQITEIAKVIDALYQQNQRIIDATQQMFLSKTQEQNPQQKIQEIQKSEQPMEQTQPGGNIPYWLEAIKNLKEVTANWAYITQQAIQSSGQSPSSQTGGSFEQTLLEPLKTAMQTLKGFHQLYTDFMREVADIKEDKK